MKRQFLILLPVFFLFIFVSNSFAQKRIPRDTSYTAKGEWEKFKNKFPEAKLVEYRMPEGVEGKRNIVFATLPHTPYGKRDLHLDLFHPSKHGKYPLVVLVHGGGWISGNRTLLDPFAQRLAAYGYITASVEYRLALEAQYPAAVYDIKAAIRYLKANANKYDIDTDRVAILGCSSGGELAEFVGVTNGVKKFEGDEGNNNVSSSVKAVVDIDGLLDFLARGSLPSNRESKSPYILWLGGSFYKNAKEWKDASSVFWVNKNAVPVLFLNSGFPHYHAGQDEMIGIMKRLRIYTEVHGFNVKMHEFWLFHPWFDQALKFTVTFLNKKLK